MPNRQRAAVITAVAGGILNLALAVVKLYIGLRTNSISILSDATNSFVDIVSCVVAGLAFFFAARPATSRFPYGFGRGEHIAGLLVAVTVVLVGLNFVYNSAARLMMPVPVWFSWLFFGIISGTAVIKLGMAQFYRYINKKLNSDAVKALMLDSYMDTAITAMALIGFLLAKYSGLTLDAVFGLVTGVMITASGVKLVINNVGALIGKGAGEDDKSAAEDVCREAGAELVSFDVHSYGANSRRGILEIRYKDMPIDIGEANRMLTEKLKEKTAIDIKIAIGR